MQPSSASLLEAFSNELKHRVRNPHAASSHYKRGRVKPRIRSILGRQREMNGVQIMHKWTRKITRRERSADWGSYRFPHSIALTGQCAQSTTCKSGNHYGQFEPEFVQWSVHFQQPRRLPFSSLPSTRSAAGRSTFVSATRPAGERLFCLQPAQFVALVDWQAATTKGKNTKIIIRKPA